MSFIFDFFNEEFYYLLNSELYVEISFFSFYIIEYSQNATKLHVWPKAGIIY